MGELASSWGALPPCKPDQRRLWGAVLSTDICQLSLTESQPCPLSPACCSSLPTPQWLLSPDNFQMGHLQLEANSKATSWQASSPTSQTPKGLECQHSTPRRETVRATVHYSHWLPTTHTKPALQSADMRPRSPRRRLSHIPWPGRPTQPELLLPWSSWLTPHRRCYVKCPWGVTCEGDNEGSTCLCPCCWQKLLFLCTPGSPGRLSRILWCSRCRNATANVSNNSRKVIPDRIVKGKEPDRKHFSTYPQKNNTFMKCPSTVSNDSTCLELYPFAVSLPPGIVWDQICARVMLASQNV